jgi:hypothetical protein
VERAQRAALRGCLAGRAGATPLEPCVSGPLGRRGGAGDEPGAARRGRAELGALSAAELPQESEGANVFTPELLARAAPALRELNDLAGEPFCLFLEPPSLDDRIVTRSSRCSRIRRRASTSGLVATRSSAGSSSSRRSSSGRYATSSTRRTSRNASSFPAGRPQRVAHALLPAARRLNRCAGPGALRLLPAATLVWKNARVCADLATKCARPGYSPSRSSIRSSRRHFGRTLTCSSRNTGWPRIASISGRARVPISRTIAPRFPTRICFCDSVST